MNYELVGPWTYKEFCDKGLNDKVTDVDQTINLLYEGVKRYVELESISFQNEFRKINASLRKDEFQEKVEILRKEKNSLENVLGGRILTSTKSGGIPKKGIKIGNRIVSFGSAQLFSARPTKKLLKENKFIQGIFTNPLDKLYSFLKEGELRISNYGGAKDVGNWNSQITFDIDHYGEIFSFHFDDPFYSAFGPNKYRAFLIK
jgi:hypothetical protein